MYDRIIIHRLKKNRNNRKIEIENGYISPLFILKASVLIWILKYSSIYNIQCIH